MREVTSVFLDQATWAEFGRIVPEGEYPAIVERYYLADNQPIASGGAIIDDRRR